MPAFTYDLVGQTAHVEVPPETADFYRADPKYTEVVAVAGEYVPIDLAEAARQGAAERAEVEQQVAELVGDKLDAAVKRAKIEHPSTLSADEKRAALIEAQTGVIADTEEK